MSSVVATPHVSWRYPTTADRIESAAADLQALFKTAAVELELVPGAEVAMTYAGEISPDELPRLTLGQGPWLLLEPPFAPLATGIHEVLRDLGERGFHIVIAHPERCPAFHRDPAMLAEIIRSGALTSITADSLVGRFGEKARAFALSLLNEGLVHNVASDFHDEKSRPPGLEAQLAEAGLSALGPWLTIEVPTAILSGSTAMPPRPHVRSPMLAPVRSRRWPRRR
jgi:protein-tyrosine phosphatase